MSSQRYLEKFKIEAARQIREHGHNVADVSRLNGVSAHRLYKWVRQQQLPVAQRARQVNQSKELRRLKAALKRATEARDILKQRRRTSLISQTEVRLYRQASSGLQRLADVPLLQLHPSGYYAWKAKPESKRAVDDCRLLGLLKQA